MKSQSKLLKILGWTITLLMPFVILMLSVRMMITPMFAQVEYRLPGFPEDPYGFTLTDRLRWSQPSIRYLVNSEGIDYLGSLRFEGGDPIFNARELSHMQDVKDVVTGMRFALAVAMIILLVLTIVLLNKDRRSLAIQAYQRGAWALVGLIVMILMFVAVSFNQTFTWFHQIFFVSGTWQFYTSDTLIRLFPMRFWRDAFIFVGLLSLLQGTLLIVFTRTKRAPR